MKWIRKIGILLFAVLLWTACNPDVNRHNALGVVSKADSLWHAGQMYGVDAGDSVTLAQAYETLSSFNSPLLSIFNSQLSTDYAHACYHYGKLLRTKDNPVEAMQAFINATHSGTDDYHILGRVYSNIGDMCHLAGDYDLSYDMFEKSANSFLQNGDTLLYYYDLANMAFELAEGRKKETSYAILDSIEGGCFDKELLVKLLEIRAVACEKVQEYDSAIFYASLSCLNGNHEPTGLLVKAQSYSYLGIKDSAVSYAKAVLETSNNPYDRNNALYIITNDDESKDKTAIREVAADRSDAQKVIELEKATLSQAILLLNQDLNRRPNLWWLISIIATLVAVGFGGSIYVHRKRKKQELLTQKLDVLKKATSSIQEKHDYLAERYLKNHKQIEEEINNKCTILRDSNTIKKTLAWKNYNRMCTLVDKQFFLLASKLRRKHDLNETEVRICVLTLLDCSYDQMAELLFRSTTSIGTLKTRVAKKLGTSTKHLRQYLIDNVCVN